MIDYDYADDDEVKYYCYRCKTDRVAEIKTYHAVGDDEVIVYLELMCPCGEELYGNSHVFRMTW